MLHDPRLDQLAKTMLDHSLGIEPGDLFEIQAVIAAKPLVAAIFKEAAARGAYPVLRWQDEEVNRLGFACLDPDNPASSRFVETETGWEMHRWQDLKARLNIRGPDNDHESSRIDHRRRSLSGKIREPLQQLIVNERRWVLFEWPTAALAQKAGMACDDYFDFCLAVSLIDYARLEKAEQALARRMEQADQVRVIAPGTNLGFSIRGMPAVCCCGRRNIPDGEVYTAPLRDSACGRITYNVSSSYWGRRFDNISLEFEQGRIVRAAAAGEASEISKILDTDPGARYIGEFSFGVNPLIRRPVGSTLFDEKITGSIHLTPGDAYARADNGNRSQIHWDLIQVQQPAFGGGEIWFDGELIRRDGIFLPPDLADLNPERLLA
jgi:aminopeptidase